MVGPLPETLVQELARAATGHPHPVVAAWRRVPAPHRVENMTTHRLERVEGTLIDGTTWSVFAKVLHPASESPRWRFIPEQFQVQVLEDLNWTDEPRVYRSLRGHLPANMRLPVIYRVDQTPTRTTLWMEDVADRGRWDLDRYRRTARVLGRLAGRWPEDRAARHLGLGRRPLARLFYGKIVNFDLPVLGDEGFWADPVITAVVEPSHRRDLEALANIVPGLLERVERLPHAASHGDATPDNFREPGDGSVVAIDWSYGSCAAVGSDLAQLLAGRFESGDADAAELPVIANVIVGGYLDGLADERFTIDPSVVEDALAINLAVRSVFSALIVDNRPELTDGQRMHLLAGRAALARFGLDLVQKIAAAPVPPPAVHEPCVTDHVAPTDVTHDQPVGRDRRPATHSPRPRRLT